MVTDDGDLHSQGALTRSAGPGGCWCGEKKL